MKKANEELQYNPDKSQETATYILNNFPDKLSQSEAQFIFVKSLYYQNQLLRMFEQMTNSALPDDNNYILFSSIISSLGIKPEYYFENIKNSEIQYFEDLQTLTEARKYNDAKKIILYAILGNLYQSIPLNEKTKIYLNRAEKLIQTIKLPDSLRYIEANVYYLKGMNYANTLDCAVAVNYFNEAISVYKSTNSPLSKINLKLAYLNKGFCLIEMKDLDNAGQMLKLAQVDINPNSEFLQSFPGIFIKQQNLFVDFGFSKLLAARGQIASSNKILYQFLSKENMPLVQLVKTDIYKQLADNYLQIGELSSSESFENLYQAERKAVQKKQEELLNGLILAEQKNNKEENQNIKRKYYSLIAIISLVGLLILIFLYMKIKKVKLKRKKIQKLIIG